MMINFTPQKRQWLNEHLLTWYGHSKRALPWRETRDPYRILLSEIMCQQTQVQTVIPYYERFLQALPCIEALSTAPMPNVLKLWEGLGYYRRARMLKSMAETVVNQLNGEIPDSREALLNLPGIGAYTAAAVASICFNEPAGVVDGNVFRVYSRFFNLDWDISLGRSRKCFQALADEAVSKLEPGDYNQAVMELGATICSPTKPSCLDCPVSKKCAVFQHDVEPETRPVKTKKTKVRNEVYTCYWIQDQEKVLLVKRPDHGMLQGLWALPSSFDLSPGHKGEPDRDADFKVQHKYSHIDATYRVFREKAVSASALKVQDGVEHAWVTRQTVRNYPITGVMRKILSAFQWHH